MKKKTIDVDDLEQQEELAESDARNVKGGASWSRGIGCDDKPTEDFKLGIDGLDPKSSRD